MAGPVRSSFQLAGPTHTAFAVQMVKVLGEGGFSFVYLAQDEVSGVSSCNTCSRRHAYHPQRQFALKKIRCPTGSEDVKQAMREVEAYRRFKYALRSTLHAPLT
jgi:serine/threonine protein kinase